MRRTFASAFATFALLALAADPPAVPPGGKEEKPPLAVGKDLPGSFQPYNVTGPHKGRFHSTVSQHGLDPMVLVFARNLEFGDPLKALLSRLDEAIEKNPAARLAACAVFLSDDLPDVVGNSEKEDDERERQAEKVALLGEGLKLKHVVLALDGRPDVEKYRLDDEAAVTVVLVNKLRVAAVHSLPADKLTEEKVKQILGEVAGKLGAKKQ
jgi:hypothetical protein